MWPTHRVIKTSWLVGLTLGLGLVIGLVTRSFWHTGIPYTHDGENHLARFANYKLALKEGQFPPRWAPSLMNRYGYPVFNYNYPLPNILAMPLVLVGASYQLTYKLLVLGSLISAAVGTFWMLSQQPLKASSKVVAVVGLLTSPYLVSAIIFRGSIGEILIIGLTPWLFGLIEWVARAGWRVRSWLAMLLVLSLWLLAHNVSVLILTPLLGLWALVRWPCQLKWWGPAVGVGLAASGLVSWFWIPALMEKSWVVLDGAGLSNQAANHVVRLGQLVWSPIQFGFSFPGPVDSLSFQLGCLAGMSWLVLVITGLVAKMSGQKNWPTVVWLSLGLAAGWVATELIRSFWRLPGVLQFVQFPWRMTLAWLVLSSWWLSWAWEHGRSWVAWILLAGLLIQLSVVARLQPVDYRYYDDAYYEAFGQSTTTANENRPKDFTYQNIGDWQPRPQIATGTAEVQVTSWTGSQHQFSLVTPTGVAVIEPTAWFPGWQTQVTLTNGDVMRVTYQAPALTDGRISYLLPSGEYTVSTTFTQRTWPRRLGNGLSLATAVVILAGWLGLELKNWRRRST